ncbi:MAG TPA: nitroreductase/quinone reductase family protein [Anaerolineales bacterium]
MASSEQIPYLYLTTAGRKSGRRHEIEIWFTELDGCYYLISELGERSHWVQNVRRNPGVHVRVGGRAFQGVGRVVDSDREPELHARVCHLSITKYNWGEGVVVELSRQTLNSA